jgi:drug/metabolite transporter (DMT)-like permease
MNRLAVVFPVIAGTCWGSAGVFVRVLYRAGFDVITITFSRTIVTVVLLAVVTLIMDGGLFRVRLRDMPLVALSGLSGYFLLNLLYNCAINQLSMSLASILLCTAPVYVILLGAILFHEKITRVKLACMLAGLFGCFLLSGILESGHLIWSLTGIMLGVGSAVSNAVMTLTVNELVDKRHMHPMTVQFYTCLIAMLLMLPLADQSAILQFLTDRPGSGALFMLAHAMVVSLLPNLLFTIAFRYLDSGVVSILASGAEPTSALLFGLLFFAEVPTVLGLIGMIIVVVSMIVLTRSNVPEPENHLPG